MTTWRWLERASVGREEENKPVEMLTNMKSANVYRCFREKLTSDGSLGCGMIAAALSGDGAIK